MGGYAGTFAGLGGGMPELLGAQGRGMLEPFWAHGGGMSELLWAQEKLCLGGGEVCQNYCGIRWGGMPELLWD